MISEEKFWLKVSKTDTCWNWVAAKTNHGYGVCWDGKKVRLATRIIWESENGKIPKNLCILHKCDNRACIRIDHLFLGTKYDNMQDMINKGRDIHPPGFKGEKNGSSKLTNKEVLEIRIKYKLGNTSSRKLAKEYNVTKTLILFIVKRKIWKHI